MKRQTDEAIRDARSATSNRLAGALPLVRNSNPVDKYLHLLGNKIERWYFGSEADGGFVAVAAFGGDHG